MSFIFMFMSYNFSESIWVYEEIRENEFMEKVSEGD